MAYFYWGVKPSEPTIRLGADPVILTTFKSATQYSDRRSPTNYSRMIGKLVPGGSFRCSNNIYVCESSRGLPASLNRGTHPYSGSNPGSGSVKVPTWMTDKVILDAILEMNDIGANLLEDMGQLRQTANLAVGIFDLIYDLYLVGRLGNWNHLRRRLRDAGSNVPKHIADGWLVYFYGIKPLLSTLSSLAQKFESKRKTFSVRKRVETSGDFRDYVSVESTVQFSGIAKWQAQCELGATINIKASQRYFNAAGFTGTPSDLLVTGWALLPYSFVIDWFVPVENWLRSLYWTPTLEYQGGYVGKRHQCSGTLTNPWPWTHIGGPYHGTLPTCRLLVKYYQRISHPYVVPSAVLGIRLALNSNQIKSAAALLIQRG